MSTNRRWYWAVIWHNPYTLPPDGYSRLMLVVEGERGSVQMRSNNSTLRCVLATVAGGRLRHGARLPSLAVGQMSSAMPVGDLTCGGGLSDGIRCLQSSCTRRL